MHACIHTYIHTYTYTYTHTLNYSTLSLVVQFLGYASSAARLGAPLNRGSSLSCIKDPTRLNFSRNPSLHVIWSFIAQGLIVGRYETMRPWSNERKTEKMSMQYISSYSSHVYACCVPKQLWGLGCFLVSRPSSNSLVIRKHCVGPLEHLLVTGESTIFACFSAEDLSSEAEPSNTKLDLYHTPQ